MKVKVGEEELTAEEVAPVDGVTWCVTSATPYDYPLPLAPTTISPTLLTSQLATADDSIADAADFATVGGEEAFAATVGGAGGVCGARAARAGVGHARRDARLLPLLPLRGTSRAFVLNVLHAYYRFEVPRALLHCGGRPLFFCTVLCASSTTASRYRALCCTVPWYAKLHRDGVGVRH